MSDLPVNQRARGFERIAIDYNHATVPGSDEYIKGQVPPVFGYGTPRVTAEGVRLDDIAWTPLGHLHARNFEDFSPAVVSDSEYGEVVFIHSVALTSNGALEESEIAKMRLNSATLAGGSRCLYGCERAAAAFNREIGERAGDFTSALRVSRVPDKPIARTGI